jgi:hypothetical protein
MRPRAERSPGGGAVSGQSWREGRPAVAHGISLRPFHIKKDLDLRDRSVLG